METICDGSLVSVVQVNIKTLFGRLHQENSCHRAGESPSRAENHCGESPQPDRRLCPAICDPGEAAFPHSIGNI